MRKMTELGFKGKCVIVTGGSRGLGYEIAREFVSLGANICICARDTEELRNAVKSLSVMKISDQQKILCKQTDISKTEDIDEMYDYAQYELNGLDIVVNNASIQGPIGQFEQVSWEDTQRVLCVDLFGTLYSMRRAVTLFKELNNNDRADKSIINISGGGATSPRPRFMGYAVAKTGVIRATEILAKETEQFGIRVNAVAPGIMNTRMLDDIIFAGEEAGLEYEKSIIQKNVGKDSIKKAANCVMWLASEQSIGISGRLISAVWDDWEQYSAKQIEEIGKNDIFTLRRVIPEDRNLMI